MKDFFKNNYPLILCVFVEIIFLCAFDFFYIPYRSSGTVDYKMYYYESDRMVSSVELNSFKNEWKELSEKKNSVYSPYAYVKIVLSNTSSKPNTFYILNRERNIKENLMEYKNFQMFVKENLPEYFYNSIYRVVLFPNKENTYYYEIEGMDIISLDIAILTEKDFLSGNFAQGSFVITLFALIFFGSFILFISSFLIKNRSIQLVSLILFVIFSFYLLIFFFPLELEKYFLRFFQMAFLLIEAILAYEFFRFSKKKSLIFITIYISFMPWLLIEGVKSTSYFFHKRFFHSYLSLLALFMSTFTFGLFIIRALLIKNKQEQEETLSYFTFLSDVSFDSLLKNKQNVSTEFLVKLRDKIQQPLEIIQAVSSMMNSSLDFSRIVSYSEVIKEYILEIKKILGMSLLEDERQTSLLKANLEIAENFDFGNFTGYKNSSICIFGSNDDIILSEKMILTGEGFFCETLSDFDQILEKINQGQIQMLIINPATDGKEIFELCEKIREKYNILQFPILMVINYYANYLVRRGYAVGVNDFVIRPFDGAELVSRCYSLLQMKDVFSKNQELARQEREKSTFLYFVTHNVNTPLTLLLNRVEEMSAYETTMNSIQKEVFRDVAESVSEINEIIQNVLISFRLSDGRYVNSKEKLFLEDVLDLVKSQMESKASKKDVKIVWNIPELLPQIFCNKQSLRGIITNLIDNAIKYTYENTTVTVSVFEENGKIILSVADEGDGVPANKVPYLFSRFESEYSSDKNRPSVGLGLYVANELSKLNDIKLEYHDGNEKGAVFSMIFESLN